jgi:hypothetical protein
MPVALPWRFRRSWRKPGEDGLDKTCAITLEQQAGAFTITPSHFASKTRIPGATSQTFDKAVRHENRMAAL